MQSDFDNPKLPPSKLLLGQALDQLRSALQLLEDAHAPGDVGAHIDLAVSRLEDMLGQGIHLALPSAMEH